MLNLCMREFLKCIDPWGHVETRRLQWLGPVCLAFLADDHHVCPHTNINNQHFHVRACSITLCTRSFCHPGRHVGPGRGV
jgi:hypothetical protein